ncbi:uncharacterized protein [Physcomitrium patens]|uniref:ADP,ATP carrier protein n=1 Tax=Physcomitrium patens TaxID=3218 RepID=A0A7I4CAS3_PHYPA|nr:uncharacterized protein LOC112275379 isoform X4 [Physcomitrium patens]|eukprot:XP_024361487.1 uncharacterized protein LOC112275379 isoform X4 [Physcomitrella patens]
MVRPFLEFLVSRFVHVHQHEVPALLHAFSAFFFLLGAYFVVLPLRDEAALSLGTGVLPALFLGSLVLTMLAAPASSYLLSLPGLPKSKALVILYRFFGGSLLVFFLLYVPVPASQLSTITDASLPDPLKPGDGAAITDADSVSPTSWHNLSWYFIGVRGGFFLWIALLNLFTISAMWARVTDVMTSEMGTRLFGFIGAGATLGQLVGSLLAVGLARLGPVLLLLAAFLMELAARCSLGVGEDGLHRMSAIASNPSEGEGEPLVILTEHTNKAGSSEDSATLLHTTANKLASLLEGVRLIFSSTYLLQICAFLWLTAVVSSFFYFERSAVVADTTRDPIGRRILLAEINSLTAIFILTGQLTVTVTNYVITRPAREILFTVTTREDKYKAKVIIDTFVQRLGDAAAAGVYKMTEALLLHAPSAIATCAFPLCVGWLWVGVALGRRQALLSRMLESSSSS